MILLFPVALAATLGALGCRKTALVLCGLTAVYFAFYCYGAYSCNVEGICL